MTLRYGGYFYGAHVRIIFDRHALHRARSANTAVLFVYSYLRETRNIHRDRVTDIGNGATYDRRVQVQVQINTHKWDTLSMPFPWIGVYAVYNSRLNSITELIAATRELWHQGCCVNEYTISCCVTRRRRR